LILVISDPSLSGGIGLSIRFLEFQHKLVHRHLGWNTRSSRGVLGVAQEIGACGKLEAGRLDFASQHALLDPMQGLADRRAGARLGRMIGDDQEPPA
jgi:hypothetical protein